MIFASTLGAPGGMCRVTTMRVWQVGGKARSELAERLHATGGRTDCYHTLEKAW